MATSFDRCLAYLDKLAPAVSGSGGHDATLQASCECVRYGLSDGEMWQAMTWFNDNRCSPPWTEKELRHKMDAAKKKANYGERGRSRSGVKPITAATLAAMSKRHRSVSQGVPDTLDELFDAWNADQNNQDHARRFYRGATAAGMVFGTSFGEPPQSEEQFIAGTFAGPDLTVSRVSGAKNAE